MFGPWGGRDERVQGGRMRHGEGGMKGARREGGRG